MTSSGAANSKAICILGMHRSGTSVITRAVNLLGAYLGEDADLMAPAPENPEGFWERNDIVALNDRILLELQRSWDCTIPLPEDWHKGERVQSLKMEMYALVEQKLAIHPLWAWKDPRSCLLLPLWKEVLDDLGIELACIFVSRNPADVAHSLQKRNGFSFPKSLGIWFNYNLSALKAAEEVPSVYLSYDDALDGGAEWLLASLGRLAVTWPPLPRERLSELRSFLRPNLRHSRSTVADLAAAPAPVRDLYAAIMTTTGNDQSRNSATVESVKALFNSFSDFSSFFSEDVVGSWSMQQEQSRTLSNSNAVGKLERQLAERTAWAQSLDQLLTTRNQRIEVLQNEVADRTAWAVKLRDEIHERDARILALQTELEERSTWALKLKAEQEARNTQVIALQAQLEERTAWALKLKAELEARDASFVQLQKEFEERTAWALSLKQVGEQQTERVLSLQNSLEEGNAAAVLLQEQIARHESQIDALEASAAMWESDAVRGKEVISSLQADLDATAAEAARLKAETAELSGRLDEERRTGKEAAMRHEAATAGLEEMLAARNAAIDELLSSWSWRITAPLRAAYEVLKGKN